MAFKSQGVSSKFPFAKVLINTQGSKQAGGRMLKKVVWLFTFVISLLVIRAYSTKGKIDFDIGEQNEKDFKSFWLYLIQQSQPFNQSCLDLINNEERNHLKSITTIVRKSQECHQINKPTSNRNQVYYGQLNGTFQVLRNIRIKKPTIFLKHEKNKSPTLVFGVIDFPGISLKQIEENNVVIKINNDDEITIKTFGKINFKPSWIDTNLVNIQRFKSRKIQYISRYNINYFTNLEVSQDTRLLGTENSIIIQDGNSTFKTLYPNMEKSEIEYYHDVESEMLILGHDFLGVYLSLEMVETKHLLKMILPKFLHRSVSTPKMKANIVLLRGPKNLKLDQYDTMERQEKLMKVSTVYSLMNKYRFYNGLLIELFGATPSRYDTNSKFPSYIYPESQVQVIIKYSKIMKVQILFHRQNDTKCMSTKDESWSSLRNTLSKMKKSSSKTKHEEHSISHLIHPYCDHDQYLLHSIEVEFDSSRLMGVYNMVVEYLNGGKLNVDHFSGANISLYSVMFFMFKGT